MVLDWLRALDAKLGKVPAWVSFACGLVMTALIGASDMISKPDLVVLYLAPVFVTSWYAGRLPGILVSVLAGSLSYLHHKLETGLTGFDLQGAEDSGVRLFVYLVLTLTFTQLHEIRRQQDSLISYIVHDLRSPIANTITGLLTLEQTSDALSEDDQEMVHLSLISSQRALRLVNSLLDMAKLQNGKMKVHFQNVEMRPLVEEALEQIALWAKNSEIALVSDVRVERADVDPELCSRVIVNLLSNALRFSPKGSTIRIEIDQDPKGVIFRISDQGAGIPADQTDLIFEPFAQAHGTKSGTGLGLTFCRLAVSAQRGEIGVKSVMGEGSTFWFSIPQN